MTNHRIARDTDLVTRLIVINRKRRTYVHEGSHLIYPRVKSFEKFVSLLLNSRTYRIVHASQYNGSFVFSFFFFSFFILRVRKDVASKYNLARRVHEKEFSRVFFFFLLFYYRDSRGSYRE